MDKDEFPHIGGVLITNMVMEENLPVCFMYRENPNLTRDSGWRLFSGLETQEYVDDSANWNYHNASSIVKRDASLAKLLLNPVGSVFERQSEEVEWHEVDSFDFEEELIVEELNEKWSFSISDLFLKIKKDDGSYFFTIKDKSVSLTIWEFDGLSIKLVHEQIKEMMSEAEAIGAPAIEHIDLSDNTMFRIGFIREESDEKKTYKVLNCSSIVDGESAMIAIYFDKDEYREWAIETWKGITYKKQ